MSWTSKNKKTVGAIGLLGTGAIAGGIAAAVIPASAATSTPSPSTSTSSTSPSGPGAMGPAHGTAAEEALEKPVTGANATKAQAAAVAIVGSGSKAGAVTTDSHGDGYEVTVTKADGTTTEVHLDSSFAVHTFGGPGGPGGAPDSTGTSSGTGA